MSDLDGMVVVVTGAAKGLGREYAVYLAQLGARVVVNNRPATPGVYHPSETPRSTSQDVVAEINEAGGTAVASSDDISTWEGAKSLVEAAIESFGELHAVVNNAGFMWDGLLVDMTEDQWDAVIGVHLKGSFATMRHAISYWAVQSERGRSVRGSIINTTSGAGLFGHAGHANYCAAKGGIQALTLAAAQEVAALGVRVNCISPSARTRWSMAKPGESVGAELRSMVLPPENPNEFDAWHPANVAPLVGWLASPACGVTGQVFRMLGSTITVMNGWTPGPILALDRRWTSVELGEAMKTVAWPRPPSWRTWQSDSDNL